MTFAARAKQISKFYAITRSFDIVLAVEQHFRDAGLLPSFEEFQAVCRFVSMETGVMQPLSADIRHSISKLKEAA